MALFGQKLTRDAKSSKMPCFNTKKDYRFVPNVINDSNNSAHHCELCVLHQSIKIMHPISQTLALLSTACYNKP
jgi:hypothetical protein